MKAAIVGLPMCGKTSLFRLLTGGGADGAAAAAGGRAQLRQAKVADARLDRLAADYRPKKITEAVIDYLDFPPLTRAGGGERKSCADLLAPAREADAIVIVVRAFESAVLPPIRGRIDPVGELEEITGELRLADMEVVATRIERIDKSLPKKRGDDHKALVEERELLTRISACLDEGGDLRQLSLTASQRKAIRGFQFLSAKPVLVVENTGEGGVTPQIPGAIPVPVAIALELEDLDEESRAMFAEEYKLDGSVRGAVSAAIYERAGMISFLTAGEPEVRAWTIPRDTRAVDAAGAIHSDIARGYIRAEVIAYADYVRDGGHSGAREKGHLRLEGKDYIVQDGDIVLFRFSV